MNLQLDRLLWRVEGKSLAPVVADCVRKRIAIFVECGRSNRSSDFRVAFETMLGVLVPEVEGSIRAGCTESTVNGVEGNGVHGIDFGYIALGGVLLTVTSEREVKAGLLLAGSHLNLE